METWAIRDTSTGRFWGWVYRDGNTVLDLLPFNPWHGAPDLFHFTGSEAACVQDCLRRRGVQFSTVYTGR